MRGVNMTAGSAKTQAPKARKRVDVDPSLLKRSTDGSAFTRCEDCNKDIAVATFDMHDCKTDAKTKAMTSRMKKDDAAETKANDDRVGTKRKAELKEPKEKATKAAKKVTKKSKKAAKDPNAPKRPSSGFFIFMETYRKTFKEENPDAKGIAAVGKAGGEKWKQMTEEEKAPYNKEAAARKAMYETAKKKYDQKDSKDDDDEPEVSEEASKSEVQDEAEDDEEAADDDE